MSRCQLHARLQAHSKAATRPRPGSGRVSFTFSVGTVVHVQTAHGSRTPRSPRGRSAPLPCPASHRPNENTPGETLAEGITKTWSARPDSRASLAGQALATASPRTGDPQLGKPIKRKAMTASYGSGNPQHVTERHT